MKRVIFIAMISFLLVTPTTQVESAPNVNSVIKGIGKMFSKKPPSKKVTKYAIGGAAANEATKDKKEKKK